MAMIGINPVAPDARKPTTLEQISEGVNIAAKILGTGLEAYKAFAVDRPAAAQELKLKQAQTNYYDAQAEKERRQTPMEEGKLSDIDKEIMQSYKDHKWAHTKATDTDSIAVYLPISKRTLYASPIKTTESKEKGFDNESKLRKEFKDDEAVKSFRTIHGATKAVHQAFVEGDFETGDAGRDIALLYNFIKIMDPGSSVKEGEVQLTTSASPILDQAVQQYRKLYSDKAALLPPALRKSMLNSIADTYTARESDFQEVVGHYKTIADSYDVDWNKVISPIQELDLSSFKKDKKEAEEVRSRKTDFIKSFGQ